MIAAWMLWAAAAAALLALAASAADAALRALKLPTRWAWTAALLLSLGLVLDPLVEQAAHPLELPAVEPAVAHEVGEQQLGRPAEDGAEQPPERARPGLLARDERVVAVRPPLLLVPDVALLLQRAEDGEHGGVGEVVGEPLAHLGHRGRPVLPEHGHHVELPIREADLHPASVD